MGVLLTPIITRDTIALGALRGQTLAVDGNGELYQFLALIRLRDGTPLQDSKGRTTSHLSGLFYRTTRLMADDVDQREPDLDGIVRFLVEEREFSRARVSAAIERTFRDRSLW